MTIEQKAKKYDEALESIKELYSKGSRVVVSKEEFETIFPELAESEDEKIRKVIRGWINTRPAFFFDNGISKEEMLAWLEKQKMKIWNKDDEHMLNICCILLNEQRKHQINQYDIDDCISWICTLKQRIGEKI